MNDFFKSEFSPFFRIRIFTIFSEFFFFFYVKSKHFEFFSANLMTCMSSLTGMAKSRPSLFFAKVITALEMLHANLPPTLTTSQVSSVRKHLKNQLLSLLKSGVSENLIEKFLVNAFTLLTDLGASKDDVLKAMPNFEAIMKRSKKKKSEESSTSGSGPKAKKAKIDIPDDDDESSEDDETEEGKSLQVKLDILYCLKIPQKSLIFQDSAVDITEKFIKDRLDPALVTELVIRCIPNIPSSIPPQFANSYTPISDAGTDGQIKHVSRLLAAQMTSLGVGPGVKEIREQRTKMPLPKIGPDSDPEEKEEIGVDPIEESRKMRNKVQLMPAGLTSKKGGTSRVRSLKLGEITKELSPETKSSLVLRAAQRIMNGEKEALIGGVPELRTKILTTLGARFSIMTKSALIAYIYSDFSKRIDMAFSWLYQEYCVLQRFHRSDFDPRKNDESEYNNVFCTLIRGVIDRTEGIERENLLRRLYLESPIITDDAIEVLKGFVTIIGSAITVVNLMKDLVMRRPTKKLNCLNFLLEFCSHDSADVRQTAIQTVLQLHADSDYKTIIEPYAIMYLKFLLNPGPPTALFTEDRGRSQAMSVWMEDTVKVCLYLFLSLLPKNQELFKNLADVYTNSKTMVYADAGQPVKVQIVILRELDLPISKVPMDSPELMDLLDDPPVGSETLITRIVHILTDKTLPSAELVAKVKKLYEDRVKDVRFLIPVLNGLSKMEVIQYLPQLIQCQTAVVKEVFMRVLSNNRGPMSPSDLLIALHTLGNDPNHTKTVVNVTKICFAERAIYDKGVLAVVLNKLMEEKDIPILFMRTVIQSLAMYPSMQGFIVNILQRLITKQVWKQKVVWDGFIKACEKTMPQSYPVMLQLPPQQLEQFLEEAPKLREPLLLHVQNFKEHQRAHVSAKTMKVLYSDYIQDRKDDEDKDGEAAVDPMAPLD